MQTTELIALARKAKSNLEKIRRKTCGSVMFVDLVGSTEYKTKHPGEENWLPRLATFLVSVTRIVEDHGRVVKYIGDEVMGFFEDPNSVLYATQAAEQVIQFCREFADLQFEVKIALDFGAVSMIDYSFGQKRSPKKTFIRRDPNGLTVDRCARIMSKTQPGVVLCGSDFWGRTVTKRSWRRAGSFKAKGIKQRVKVYQLILDNSPGISIADERMTLTECMSKLATVERRLEISHSLRRTMPRSSR